MRWPNLRKNRCPKCGKILGFNESEEMVFCNDLACGFQISQYRMERLVGQMNARPAPASKDNFADLQSLGCKTLDDDEQKGFQYLDI